MRFLNTDGIVIKKVDYSDADRLLSIFTERYGLVHIAVKGIRKSKHRDRNGTELISMSKFTMYKKADHLVLSNLELLNPFLGVKSDPFKINISIYMLSLLNKILVERERREKLYKLVINCFKYIDKEDDVNELILLLVYFLFQIMKEEGIEFEIGDGSYFNIVSCKVSSEKSGGRYLNHRQLEFLNGLSCSKVEYLRELGFTKQELEDVISLLQDYLNYHLNININYKLIVREGF